MSPIELSTLFIALAVLLELPRSAHRVSLPAAISV